MDPESGGKNETKSPFVLERCGIVLDRATGKVALRGRPISLTNRELQVLSLLMAAGGKALSAAEVQRHVWPESGSGSPSQVAMIVARLRRRLGNPRLIETIGGEGYRIAGSNETFRGP